MVAEECERVEQLFTYGRTSFDDKPVDGLSRIASFEERVLTGEL